MIIINHQETNFQNNGSISIKIVLTFKINVKNTIDNAKLLVIKNGLFIHFSCTLQPIIIGRRGKTQGAKIVKMPAKKDAKSNSILF